MKILSIRLHPFGATNDRTTDLRDGLNVLEGPNEFGKSTLTQALWHGLHTPSNLTPKRLSDIMGPYYPFPDGDHARVTLRFEANGASWTLEKTWGAGKLCNSKLVMDGGAPIADAGRVQAKLNELLRLNEATWKQVLFTRQAELARIVEALEGKSTELDDVSVLLEGAAAIQGDIAADKLKNLMEAKIDAHYQRWDRTRSGPQDGRGINKPFTKGVGPVLAAYYLAESSRTEREKVLADELKFDAVTSGISKIQGELAADTEFVKQGLTLRQGLVKRDSLQSQVNMLTSEVDRLMKIPTAWERAKLLIESKNADLVRISESLKKLDEEIGHARQRAAATALQAGHKRLTADKAAMSDAKTALEKVAPVDGAALKELQNLRREIDRLDIEIAAQKLAAKLESESNCSVTLQHGTGDPETIELTPGTAWTGELSGRFSLEAGDLRISVQSGMEDVDLLFAKRGKAASRSAELLKSMGHTTLAEAEAASKMHEERDRELKNKVSLYKAALGEKSEEEWAAAMTALAELPATRDLKTLEDERNTLVQQQATANTEADQNRKEIQTWTTDHTDPEQLTIKVFEKREGLQKAKNELATLPTLPEGFEDVEAYLKKLEQKEAAQSQLKDHLATANNERAALEATRSERTAEDLKEELDLKERVFQRELEEGNALLRIQAKLEAVIEERGAGDPMQGLKEAVSRHFAALTKDKYTEVKLNGMEPENVSGAVALPTKLLSQGTLGSLALAIRLALAELYLKDDNGFLVLDDPFTDMDPVRRSAAAKAIGQFAQDRQVLLFTCHPAHAQELQQLAGAQMVAAS